MNIDAISINGRVHATATGKGTLLGQRGWRVDVVHCDAVACTLRASSDSAEVEATVLAADLDPRQLKRFASILPPYLKARCVHKLYEKAREKDALLPVC
jgi:hypothetical protein